MTPSDFDECLAALGWKTAYFCDRTGIAPSSVWRWCKAMGPVPKWVGEYLRMVIALQRLHVEFVAARAPDAQTFASVFDAPGRHA